MLLVLATKRPLIGLSAAPPNVAAPGPPMHPTRPVEVLIVHVLPDAVLAIFLLHLLHGPVPVLPEGDNALPKLFYLDAKFLVFLGQLLVGG